MTTSPLKKLVTNVSDNDIPGNQSIKDIHESFNNLDGWINISLSTDAFFSKIPIVAEMVATTFIFVFANFVNILVVKFYVKSKCRSRPYILGLAVLDLVGISFAVFPRILLRVLRPCLARVVLRITLHLIFVEVYNMYMYGPLLLAIDRFLVVQFPHNFREMKRRSKYFIYFLPSLHFLVMVAVVASEIFLGQKSLAFFVLSNIGTVLKLVQILGCAIMYRKIVVKISASQRKMGKFKHKGGQYSIIR